MRIFEKPSAQSLTHRKNSPHDFSLSLFPGCIYVHIYTSTWRDKMHTEWSVYLTFWVNVLKLYISYNTQLFVVPNTILFYFYIKCRGKMLGFGARSLGFETLIYRLWHMRLVLLRFHFLICKIITRITILTLYI